MADFNVTPNIYTKKSFHQYLADHNIMIHYRTMIRKIKESCGYYEDEKALDNFRQRRILRSDEISKFIMDWL